MTTLSSSSRSPRSATARARDAQLIRWFLSVFVPDPKRGYAVMNLLTARAKYTRKSETLTRAIIEEAFSGTSRRLEIDGRWHSFPLSLAVVPRHRDGWALAAIAEIDHGGQAMVEQVLTFCQGLGLWAFAQLSTGLQADDSLHDGGHVYIPFVDQVPADVLRLLAAGILQATGARGEANPGHNDLRLPLMMHLRAPNGPCRFPLLLQTGELIDATDPWAALARLHEVWQPNPSDILPAVLAALPDSQDPTATSQPPISKRHPPTPRTRVREDVDSVIRWYNRRVALGDGLADLGGRSYGRLRVVRCPWHDDRTPSLVVWELTRDGEGQGYEVCRCFSGSSGCWASEGAYVDAFNIYCNKHSLTQKEAVARLVEEHGLGQRHDFRVIQQVARPALTETVLQEHQMRVEAARADLGRRLRDAADRRGHVTLMRMTPGLGKTFGAAQLARQINGAGKQVAVVAASHALAEQEWKGQLPEAMVWQPKTAICTCHAHDQLAQEAALGYALPTCRDGCPYREQFDARTGRIVIYQHNHLHLFDGSLFGDADVVIVDESPLGALLEEQTATTQDIQQLIIRMQADSGSDPAQPFLHALATITPSDDTSWSIRGRRLLEIGHWGLGIGPTATPHPPTTNSQSPLATLQSLLANAQRSPFAQARRRARDDGSALGHQFLPGLLDALAHDLANLDGNTRLAYARVKGNTWAWSWYERHRLLPSLVGRADAPAVIVLDGSADAVVARELYTPWPMTVETIDVPLSPAVEVIQCLPVASTRRLVWDADQQRRLIETVAATCDHLGVTIDAGISYKDMTVELEARFGCPWLHYGGLRGMNALSDARVLALIASPTVPHDAIIRKAMALWADAAPIDQSTPEQIARGAYRYADARLEALNRLHGLEELRQALHRPRPILSMQSRTILIFSPWPVADLGFAPDRIVEDVPHGNSTALKQAATAYWARMQKGAVAVSDVEAEDSEHDPLQNGVSASLVTTVPANEAPAGMSERLPTPNPHPPTPDWDAYHVERARRYAAAGRFGTAYIEVDLMRDEVLAHELMIAVEQAEWAAAARDAMGKVPVALPKGSLGTDVVWSYVCRLLEAGDETAMNGIETHCRLHGADADAVIRAAHARGKQRAA